MKKFISAFLSIVIILSVFIVPVQAAGEETSIPAFADFFEKHGTNFVSLFGKLWNTLVKTDETEIPAAPEFTPSYKEYSGEINIIPEETYDAETWVSKELVFESEKKYSDPFNDVDVDLLLYGDGKIYTIPAFWDGGNTWKFRFVCPSEGEWFFETVCSDEENTSLHKRTGKVICKEYSGDLDIYKHGFVTTSYGKKYFTYADGTPFFYLGDTHWSMGGETIDMVKTICEKRVSQNFTVFQSEPIDATFSMHDGITENDMDGFRINDEKFKIIADSGLVHANAQFFFPYLMEILIEYNGGYSDKVIADGMKELSEEARHYLEKISRYWVARYSSYPVMWTLGQEVDNDFYWNDTTHPDWNYINNPYKLVAEYIAKYDPYTHPLTAHQENSGTTAAYGNGKGATDKCRIYNNDAVASCFRDVKSHTFYAAQWTPSKTEQSDFTREKDFWYNSQGKPAINYEGQYCYLWTKNFGARMQGWVSYLNGMYGYGWGGHDTWSYLNIYDEENDSSDGVDTITSEEKINATWQDSLEYSSSYQVGYMRNFLEKCEWYNLIPRFDNLSYFAPCTNVYYTFASNKDNSEMVIYFYSFTDEHVAEKTNTRIYGGLKTGTVGNLEPETKYIYQWFNPVTGEEYDEKEFTSSFFGTYYLGAKPDDTDMAIRIVKGE